MKKKVKNVLTLFFVPILIFTVPVILISCQAELDKNEDNNDNENNSVSRSGGNSGSIRNSTAPSTHDTNKPDQGTNSPDQDTRVVNYFTKYWRTSV